MPLTDEDIIIIKEIETFKNFIDKKVFKQITEILSEHKELEFDKVEIFFDEETFTYSMAIKLKPR